MIEVLDKVLLKPLNSSSIDLRILTGKKHPQITLQRLRKVWI